MKTKLIITVMLALLASVSANASNESENGGGLGTVKRQFVKIRFVPIRPGSFMMGTPERDAELFPWEKQHLVKLTNAFEMQMTPVTQKQYFDVMGTNPSFFQNQQNCPQTFMEIDGASLCPNHPVEQVSYSDAQFFILRLNHNNTDGYFYRLPTEAEWEYAARAGSSARYSFGNDLSRLALYSWFSENSSDQTHEVAHLRANDFGLYDMHGNVHQWIQDWFAYDYGSGNQINPSGPSSGRYRATRGGAWDSDAELLRSANRGRSLPSNQFSNLGFRLVRQRVQN